MNRIYTADAPFDYDGKFYKLKAVSGKPRPLQQPRPITLNAAFSPPGREFAAKARTICSRHLPRSKRGVSISTI